MTYLTVTAQEDVYAKAVKMLERYFGRGGAQIDFSNPKPAFKGAYAGGYDFNISHSGGLAAIAVSDGKIGCDIEVLKGRRHPAVCARLSEEERADAADERGFLKIWTAKEAFIKMNGLSLATHLKRLAFTGGRIYLDGRPADCPAVHFMTQNAVICVCGDDDIRLCEI